jgi:hypothetical protein
MTAEEIKSKLSLRSVAALCGIDLPRDGQKFRSPFRPDQNPSCAIKGEIFTDWSGNEHFDAIGFFAAAKGISNAEAIRALRGHLGGLSVTAGAVKVAKALKKLPVIPPVPIANPTKKLLECAAASRGLTWEAFEAARTVFKTLTFGTLFEQTCWFLHDASQIGWEARRCDGKPFDPVGSIGERKSHSKGQGLKSWPMGINPTGFPKAQLDKLKPRILLVEGGPDYIAACQLILDLPNLILPCAMLGKSADISPSALPLFRGRHVSIAGHPDAEARVVEWANQIKSTGAASVHPVLLDCNMDLNDWLKCHPARAGELRDLLKLT